MQIVIEIPEAYYEALRKTETVVSGQRSGETFMSVIYSFIANGTPLPKGHGDLIDRDLLRKRISEDKREVFTKHEVWLLASKYNTDVPMVVPTDKEKIE